MSRKVSDLVPALQPLAAALLAHCAEQGFPLVVTQTLRTRAEQAALFAQGRTAPGKVVTNAPPGTSRHETGEAFDVAFRTVDGGVSWDGPWEEVGQAGEALGLEWGGRWKGFKDKPHFQLRREAAAPPAPTRPTLPPMGTQAIRAALKRLGYSAASARDNVLAFQLDHPPLAVDGVPGPKTQAALRAALDTARAALGPEGEE